MRRSEVSALRWAGRRRRGRHRRDRGHVKRAEPFPRSRRHPVNPLHGHVSQITAPEGWWTHGAAPPQAAVAACFDAGARAVSGLPPASVAGHCRQRTPRGGAGGRPRGQPWSPPPTRGSCPTIRRSRTATSPGVGAGGSGPETPWDLTHPASSSRRFPTITAASHVTSLVWSPQSCDRGGRAVRPPKARQGEVPRVLTSRAAAPYQPALQVQRSRPRSPPARGRASPAVSPIVMPPAPVDVGRGESDPGGGEERSAVRVGAVVCVPWCCSIGGTRAATPQRQRALPLVEEGAEPPFQ